MIDFMFNMILSMSIVASFVILCIVFVRLFLKKMPAIYSYLLWLIVLFRLLCPVYAQSDVSMIPAAFLEEQIVTHDIDAVVKTESDLYERNEISKVPHIEESGYYELPFEAKEKSVLPYIWLVGTSILFFISIIQFIGLKKKIQYGIRSTDHVYICEHIDVPFVLGIFRPNAYIPMSLEHNNYVLQHELVHIKRKDYLVKFLFWLAVMVHWFNPLVWLSFALMNQDMEMSCDERVVKHYQKNLRLEYAAELLNMTMSKNHRLFPGFSEGCISKRIKNLLKNKKVSLISKIILPCLGMIAVACLLSNPVKEQISKVDLFQEVDARNIPVKEAEWAMNTLLDTTIPDLDFANDHMIVMHSYFGLFIYDLENKRLNTSIDLKALGCQEVQSGGPCDVLVSEDGSLIWIHPYETEFMYRYHVQERKLEKIDYEIPETYFQEFQLSRDLLEGETDLALHRCSAKAIEFEDGTCGYLYVGNGVLSEMQYRRGTDRWNLFTKEDSRSPILLKQDDSFYESFRQMSKKSFADFTYVYTLMYNIKDYYGVCYLSQNVEYTDEMQQKWKEIGLSVSGQELEHRGDKACYEIQLSVAGAEGWILENGEHTRYLYAVNGEDGWYAEGMLHREIPPSKWWDVEE